MNEVNEAIAMLQGKWRSEDGSTRFDIEGTDILNITGPSLAGVTKSEYQLEYDKESEWLEIRSMPIFQAWPGVLMIHNDGNSFQVIPMGTNTTGKESPHEIPVTTRYFRVG